MTVFIPVIAAVVGAFISASFLYWLHRARPVVIVDNIRKTADYCSDREDAVLNADLIEDIEGSSVLGVMPSFGSGALTEREYLRILVKAKEVLREQTGATLPRLLQAAKRFRRQLAEEDFDAAIQTWARHQTLLWRVLVNAKMRGNFDMIGQRPDYDSMGLSAKHEVSFNDQGEPLIATSGAWNLHFTTRVPLAQKPSISLLARRAADAFSCEYKQELVTLANGAISVGESLSASQNALLAAIEEEIEPHLRFTVDAAVGNVGRSAVSLSNRAKLVIKTKGYPGRDGAEATDHVDLDLTVGSLDESVPVLRLVGDEGEEVSLLRDEKDEFESPKLIAPGALRRFVCVAEKPVTHGFHPVSLTGAFSAGNLQAYLVLAAIKRENLNFKPIYSGNFLFRELARRVELPRRKGD
ncbi:hypothetical protein ACIPSH_09250 [Streptomyces iakyrus]|uniref:hypothetical protein n=1 Tax=Streptomyces iakyrus TaxID=68219 RepID=UPI00382FA127